ncbi:MAG: hypothetical protein ACR2PA_16750 [Hyphomicrobiaceae bacterium]
MQEQTTASPAMQTYLISYDLAEPQANKHVLASAIMMLGDAWARPLDQTWYLRADIEETDIDSVLHQLLGDDDGLLVQAVEQDAILSNTQLRWFRQRRQPLADIETNVVAFPAVPELPGVDEPIEDLALAS